MKKLLLVVHECANNKVQWECHPMPGVTAYSAPSTKEVCKERGRRFAERLGREAEFIDDEETPYD